MRILRGKNYAMIRSAGSHGPCDLLVADPAGARYAIQVKSGKAKASTQERLALKFIASRFQATPQIWTFRPREPVQVETL
jgi:predicted RecB family endonuclease